MIGKLVLEIPDIHESILGFFQAFIQPLTKAIFEVVFIFLRQHRKRPFFFLVLKVHE